MQLELNVRVVRIPIDVVNTMGVERRRATNDSMDRIALGQQEFGQVATVLSSDAGNQCRWLAHALVLDFVVMEHQPRVFDRWVFLTETVLASQVMTKPQRSAVLNSSLLGLDGNRGRDGSVVSGSAG